MLEIQKCVGMNRASDKVASILIIKAGAAPKGVHLDTP